MDGDMGCDCIFTTPVLEPARGSEKVTLWLLPVADDFGEPEFNVIGSSD